jgi:hypothetical protein
MFLDLFGVNLLPTAAEVQSSMGSPAQLCSWLPSEGAAAAGGAAMHALLHPGTGGGGVAAAVLPNAADATAWEATDAPTVAAAQADARVAGSAVGGPSDSERARAPERGAGAAAPPPPRGAAPPARGHPPAGPGRGV